MNCFKLVFIVVLSVLMGPCSLFAPKTTYYYVINSSCTYDGYVQFTMPGGQIYTNYNVPLYYFVSKAYKFKSNDFVHITASLYTQSYKKCANIAITITIMKSQEATEGNIGTGGSVWRTKTGFYAVSISAYAD